MTGVANKNVVLVMLIGITSKHNEASFLGKFYGFVTLMSRSDVYIDLEIWCFSLFTLSTALTTDQQSIEWQSVIYRHRLATAFSETTLTI